MPVPWPIALALIVGGLIPTPARITTEVLPAIDVAQATAHLEREDERVEEAHARIHGALQDAVRNMRHDRLYAA